MEKESCTIFHGWNLKKTKVATKNKAVFNKAICANEIKYMGINSIVSNIYRFIEEILYSKTFAGNYKWWVVWW